MNCFVIFLKRLIITPTVIKIWEWLSRLDPSCQNIRCLVLSKLTSLFNNTSLVASAKSIENSLIRIKPLMVSLVFWAYSSSFCRRKNSLCFFSISFLMSSSGIFLPWTENISVLNSPSSSFVALNSWGAIRTPMLDTHSIRYFLSEFLLNFDITLFYWYSHIERLHS